MVFRHDPLPGVIEPTPDGRWKCGKCDYTSDRWNGVLGHQGRHSTKKRDVGARRRKSVMKADPIDMTFGELIATIEELRVKVTEEQKRAQTAEAKFTKVRSLLFSSVAEDGPDQT